MTEKRERLTLNTFFEWLLVLLIMGTIIAVGSLIGFQTSFIESIPGILILVAICLVGLSLSKIVPINIPAIAYIGILGMIVAAPFSPIAGFIVKHTDKINLLATATPVLAYSGVAIGKNWGEFTKMGWRAIVVTLCVMFGTFMGSAIIAQLVLSAQGII